MPNVAATNNSLNKETNLNETVRKTHSESGTEDPTTIRRVHPKAQASLHRKDTLKVETQQLRHNRIYQSQCKVMRFFIQIIDISVPK